MPMKALFIIIFITVRPTYHTTHTSGSRTSETGGPIFCRNFFTTFFFRRFPKNVSISRKNFIYLPKFLTTFIFLVINYFRVLIYWFSVGGPNPSPISIRGKSLNLHKFTILPLLFLPPWGEPNSIANFDGRAMAGFALPWIRH